MSTHVPGLKAAPALPALANPSTGGNAMAYADITSVGMKPDIHFPIENELTLCGVRLVRNV